MLAHACVVALVSVAGLLDLALEHQVQESHRSQPGLGGSYGVAR